MARVEILHCFPTLKKTEKGWKKYGEIVGRYDERGLAVSEGSRVLQIVENGRVIWIDPATGRRLHRTRKGIGNGLWDKENQVYYHPYMKEDF